MNLNIGLLYLSLHNQLRKKIGLEGTITRKILFEKLGRHYLIPKNLRDVVIEEMKQRKMLKEVEKGKFKLIGGCLDIEKDVSKIYKMAGLYD
jgi:hypothetical protein